MSVLSSRCFHCEEAAFEHLESIVWANGVTCPHCGSMSGKHYDLRKTRTGLRKCSDCRKQFTVKVGTVFESAHIPLNKMLQAVYLMCASKKGISAHQLHRVLGITYKSAWFLCHRIREAMRSGDLAPMGGNGGAVEVDETFIGREPGKEKKRAYHHKMKVLSLVDRETGKARSMVVDNLHPKTLVPILKENIDRESRIMTDEAGQYHHLKNDFADHAFTRHGAGEYVSMTDRTIHTNTIEGYFSIFKRGMKGVYQHCAKHHLHRYLAEFDFRYNNRSALGIEDGARHASALGGIIGKRLTYRSVNCP
ncbi:MAG: IS1595 family transposase [Methylobacterium sp.]|nr:IS1595 family transposase [Methylobacterium sp.]MCA3656892.1 IS1595 family transposase [Methylobacterium sp.]MCA3661268.1 IS1595 family transposase [Methylobacterium sp.]MCA3664609.1 IS1595 family transposase [Methylobacterium sp.]MCA3667944.1 IS1595 family transposase [Methylobacterium sp.]